MISSVFRNKLLDGERVVWSGQPGQGIILTGRDGLMIPFSLLWGGFAIFWEASVFRIDHSPFIMKLWGIPFVLVGIYLIIGRFILDAYLRKKIYYAVTNQRILIMRSRPFASFTALNLDRLPALTIIESPSGKGTIYFGPQGQALGRNGFDGWTPSLGPTAKFIAVENAKTVFGQIQRVMRPA